MKNEEKILVLKSILKVTFIMICISAILKVLGLNVFAAEENNKGLNLLCSFLKKYNLNQIVSIFLLVIESFIILRLSCSNKNKKIYYLSAVISSIINFLSQVLIFENINHHFYTISMVLVLIITASIIDKKINIKKPLLVLLAISIYQLLTMFLRNITVNYKYEEMYYLLLNFDYLILLLMSYYLFLKQGIKEKPNLFYNFSLLRILNQVPSLADIKILFIKLYEKVKMFSDASRKDKAFVIIYVLLLIVSELFNFAIIILVAYLNHTIIECFFILSSFLITKKVFGTPFHFDSAIKCWIVSNVTYYILNRVTFNIRFSLVIPILLGITLSFFTSKLVKKNNGSLYRGMPEEELIVLCKSKKLNKFETDILKDFYSNRLTITKMTIKYNYSRSAIFIYKSEALKKIGGL